MNGFRFTPGPWVVDESRYEGSVNRLEPFRHIGMVSQFQHDAESREQNAANAKLIAAAPDLLIALKGIVDNAEQRAFEDWLSRTAPSGDCDSVHSQWLESSDCSDFAAEWDAPLTAITKAIA